MNKTFLLSQRAVCLLFGISQLFFSCTSQRFEEQIPNSPTFKVVSFDPFRKIDFQKFAKDLEYVVLETKPDYLISSIDKIEVKNSKIFVLSKGQKTIFIFSRSGKIIGKISDFGDGPGKYSGISDFGVVDTFIYLLTSPSKYLYKYDFFGELIEIVPTNGNYIYEIGPSKNGWIAHLKDAFDSENSFNLVHWDSTFSVRLNQFLFIESERRNSPFLVDNYISNNGKNLFLFQNFSNLIYSFKNDSLSLSYEILLNDQGVPSDFMRNFNSSPIRATNLSIEENIFTGIKKILSTDKILFLELMKGSGTVSSFISTQSDNSFSYFGLDFKFDFGMAGNIIGNDSEKFIMKISESMMNELKDLDIKGQINENNLKNDDIRKAIRLYEKEGNPVLVFFDIDFDKLHQ
jgi:hypothetical protein